MQVQGHGAYPPHPNREKLAQNVGVSLRTSINQRLIAWLLWLLQLPRSQKAHLLSSAWKQKLLLRERRILFHRPDAVSPNLNASAN